MKKTVVICWIVAVFFASLTSAADMPGRRDYLGQGVFQTYIGYWHEASDICGVTTERLAIHGWDVVDPSYWELVSPGQMTRYGIYRIESDGCSAGFTLTGTVHEWEYQGGWGSITITAHDILLLYGEDIFGRNPRFRNTIRRLKLQGVEFHLVQIREWNKVFLKMMSQNMPGKTYVGAILPNDRGFLQHIVLGDPGNIQVSHDMPLVLIFKD